MAVPPASPPARDPGHGAESGAPLVRTEAEAPLEAWDDPVRGRISFRTFFSGGQTPTGSLTVGVAEVAPAGWLGVHRHSATEAYYVLAGHGVVELEGTEHAVGPGSAVFVPGQAEHGVRNTGDTPLRVVYTLAADSFADIDYRFRDDDG